MAIIRTIALSLVLTMVVAVLTGAAIQLWNYRQQDHSRQPLPDTSTIDERSRALQDRVEILTKRVGDMELLVLVLLGTSGLYAMVFVASSYFSARSFARQADRTVAHIKDQIGVAMGDLRELQEQTQRKVSGQEMGRASEPARAGAEELEADTSPFGSWETRVTGMAQRIALWIGRSLSTYEQLELVRSESEAAYLEVAGGRHIASAMANLYRTFAAIHAADDPIRARFYLDRALVLAFAEPQLESEVRYDLACWFAGAHDLEQAIRELASAFQHHSKALDARLAIDLEEGGKLYRLASTPPFDKQVNDLLLNVSIP